MQVVHEIPAKKKCHHAGSALKGLEMFTTIVGLGAAGLLLLFLEMFLPGMIAGIAGAILLIISVVMSYEHFGSEGGNVSLIIALVATGILWWWWATHFQNTRFGRSMTLQESGTGTAVTPGLSALVGSEGTALTTLRPGGTILIDGKKVDAISDGELIESGAGIRIISAQGICVIVRRIKL